MARKFKDHAWLPDCTTWEKVAVSILMDLRDELKAINRRLDCHETLSMPRHLRKIATNTSRIPTKKKRK